MAEPRGTGAGENAPEAEKRDEPTRRARPLSSWRQAGVIAAAWLVVAGVAVGLWAAWERQTIGPLAQPRDPAVQLPKGWDLPPPTSTSFASSRQLTPVEVKALEERNASRSYHWQFRVELPVKASECFATGSPAAAQSCAEAPDGEERVAMAVISGSRSLIHALGGTFERDRLFYLDGLPSVPGRKGYFQFVRVTRNWVRVSDPSGYFFTAIDVTITPPASSLRKLSGKLLRTTDLSPPTLRPERALTLVRRWLDTKAPLSVELVAVPASQSDMRVTRLCYLLHMGRTWFWIDAHTGEPYHAVCGGGCGNAASVRLARIVARSPSAFVRGEPVVAAPSIQGVP